MIKGEVWWANLPDDPCYLKNALKKLMKVSDLYLILKNKDISVDATVA